MSLVWLLSPASIVIMRGSVGCGLCDGTRGLLTCVAAGSATGSDTFVICAVVARVVGNARILTLFVVVRILMAAVASWVRYGLELGPVVDRGDLDGRCHCHRSHLGLGSMRWWPAALRVASSGTGCTLTTGCAATHRRGSASMVLVLAFDCPHVRIRLFLLIWRVGGLLAPACSVVSRCLVDHAWLHVVVTYDILLDFGVVLIFRA